MSQYIHLFTLLAVLSFFVLIGYCDYFGWMACLDLLEHCTRGGTRCTASVVLVPGGCVTQNLSQKFTDNGLKSSPESTSLQLK